MREFTFDEGNFRFAPAWTTGGIKAAMEALLHKCILPESLGARLLIKPNLNNDLIALTGNSTDLRVLAALIESLQRRGYKHIAIADGPNVGVDRREIDVFHRLRLDALCQHFQVGLHNLNHGPATRVTLSSGIELPIARVVVDADYVISVPTVKTHAEAGMSIACKNWVGIVQGQDKRLMHRDLPRNIASLIARFPPDLIIVDAIVAMEGNGPGDGEPIPLGLLAASDNPFVCDLAMCRLLGFSWKKVPYLTRAHQEGVFDPGLVNDVAAKIQTQHQIKAAPPRSPLAKLSERRSLFWLKRLLRPLTSRNTLTHLAYRAGVIQDVYNRVDDSLRLNRRRHERCGSCQRCADFCPMGLSRQQIGAEVKSPACIDCLYCYWVCPKDALELDGEPGGLERQLRRYKSTIEGLKS